MINHTRCHNKYEKSSRVLKIQYWVEWQINPNKTDKTSKYTPAFDSTGFDSGLSSKPACWVHNGENFG